MGHTKALNGIVQDVISYQVWQSTDNANKLTSFIFFYFPLQYASDKKCSLLVLFVTNLSQKKKIKFEHINETDL